MTFGSSFCFTENASLSSFCTVHFGSHTSIFYLACAIKIHPINHRIIEWWPLVTLEFRSQLIDPGDILSFCNMLTCYSSIYLNSTKYQGHMSWYVWWQGGGTLQIVHILVSCLALLLVTCPLTTSYRKTPLWLIGLKNAPGWDPPTATGYKPKGHMGLRSKWLSTPRGGGHVLQGDKIVPNSDMFFELYRTHLDWALCVRVSPPPRAHVFCL